MAIKILILNCGGTITCDEVDGALSPRLKFGDIYKDEIFDEVFPIGKYGKDSSTMTTKDIKKIAKTIYKNRELYDGFLVLHGTDTMSYTASFLYYMLPSSLKVVITGSMIAPIFEYTDARENIKTALEFLRGEGGGAKVAFNGKVLNANNIIKLNTTTPDAITELPFAPPSPTQYPNFILKNTIKTFHININTTVHDISDILNHCDGCVFLVFGAGGAKKEIFKELYNQAKKGKLIAIKTITPFGLTNLDTYASSKIKPHKNIFVAKTESIESIFARMSLNLVNKETNWHKLT